MTHPLVDLAFRHGYDDYHRGKPAKISHADFSLFRGEVGWKWKRIEHGLASNLREAYADGHHAARLGLTDQEDAETLRRAMPYHWHQLEPRQVKYVLTNQRAVEKLQTVENIQEVGAKAGREIFGEKRKRLL